jgi:hypothetical protein
MSALQNSTAGSGGQLCWSNGFWDGTKYYCAYVGGYVSGGWTLVSGSSTSFLAHLELGGDGGDYVEATITVDATNISVTWTKTGNPVGTVPFILKCGV